MPAPSPLARAVLDTNVLVAAAYAESSASRRIVEACIEGHIAAAVTRAVAGEYRAILARAIRKPGYEDRLAAFLERVESVEPARLPPSVPDDPDDDKLLAAAVGGAAGWLVTNDHHLLVLDPFRGVRIVLPTRFAEEVLGE